MGTLQLCLNSTCRDFYPFTTVGIHSNYALDIQEEKQANPKNGNMWLCVCPGRYLYSFSKILMTSVCAADNLQKLKFPQFRIKSSLVTWRRFGFEKEFLFLYMQMRKRMSQQNSQSKSAALLQLLNKICVLISHRENVKSRSTFGTMQDLCDF